MTENCFTEDEPPLIRSAQPQWLSVKTNIQSQGDPTSHITMDKLKLDTPEPGWNLGPFAAVPATGQPSPPAAKYKETIRD